MDPGRPRNGRLPAQSEGAASFFFRHYPLSVHYAAFAIQKEFCLRIERCVASSASAETIGRRCSSSLVPLDREVVSNQEGLCSTSPGLLDKHLFRQRTTLSKHIANGDLGPRWEGRVFALRLNYQTPCWSAGGCLCAGAHDRRLQGHESASRFLVWGSRPQTPAEPGPPAFARGKLLICDAGWNG